MYLFEQLPVALLTNNSVNISNVNYSPTPGADVNRHDGVYSGYFMNYTSDGAYTFSADVTTTKKSRIKTKGSYGIFPMGAVEKGNYIKLILTFKIVLALD